MDTASNAVTDVMLNAFSDLSEKTAASQASLQVSMDTFTTGSRAEGLEMHKSIRRLDGRLKDITAEMHKSVRELQHSFLQEMKSVQASCAHQEDKLRWIKKDQEQQAADRKQIWKVLEPMHASVQSLVDQSLSKGSTLQQEVHSQQQQHDQQQQLQQPQGQQQQQIPVLGLEGADGPSAPPGFDRASTMSIIQKHLESSSAGVQQLVRQCLDSLESNFKTMQTSMRTQHAKTALMSQRIGNLERLLQPTTQAACPGNETLPSSNGNNAIPDHGQQASQAPAQHLTTPDQRGKTSEPSDKIKLLHALAKRVNQNTVIASAAEAAGLTSSMPQGTTTQSDSQQEAAGQTSNAAQQMIDLHPQRNQQGLPSAEIQHQPRRDDTASGTQQTALVRQQGVGEALHTIQEQLYCISSHLGMHENGRAHGCTSWMAELQDIPRATALVIRSQDAVLGHLESLQVTAPDLNQLQIMSGQKMPWRISKCIHATAARTRCWAILRACR